MKCSKYKLQGKDGDYKITGLDILKCIFFKYVRTCVYGNIVFSFLSKKSKHC